MNLKNSLIWSIGTVTLAATVVLGYLWVATTSTSYNNGNQKSGALSSLLVLICLVAFSFAIMAIFRLSGWKKIIPIICSIVVLIVFGLALFAASFSSYGQPY